MGIEKNVICRCSSCYRFIWIFTFASKSSERRIFEDLTSPWITDWVTSPWWRNSSAFAMSIAILFLFSQLKIFLLSRWPKEELQLENMRLLTKRIRDRIGDVFHITAYHEALCLSFPGACNHTPTQDSSSQSWIPLVRQYSHVASWSQSQPP